MRVLASLPLVALFACTPGVDTSSVVLATTTSVQDSGLLEVLVPLFELQSGLSVKTVAVGTGEALAMAARGEADVVLAHAPTLEVEAIESGVTQNRRRVMHNDFVILGPPEDPAGVGGLSEAAAGFRRIAQREAPFLSRGDNSGTHVLERRLWVEGGAEPAGAWYLESGQGMAATLLIACDRSAYALSDRATYLALRDNCHLVPVLEGDPALLNVYSVMEVNPLRFPEVNSQGAADFARFMVGDAAQGVMREFGVARFGRPLFVPDSLPDDTSR